MYQEEIKRLLHEAAQPKCSDRRMNGIQILLTRECQSLHDAMIIDSLYVSTFQNRREHLPALFPIFALLCGERDRTVVSIIDWSLCE